MNFKLQVQLQKEWEKYGISNSLVIEKELKGDKELLLFLSKAMERIVKDISEKPEIENKWKQLLKDHNKNYDEKKWETNSVLEIQELLFQLFEKCFS